MKKLVNFYWGGSPLSYLQYLSIASFKKHNPDWRINLFIPDTPGTEERSWVTNEQSTPYTGKDYLPQAKKLCNVIKLSFDEHTQGRQYHDIHRADISRWHILYEYGGIWSDIDILYTQPVGGLFKIDFDVAIVYHEDPYIGFLIAQPRQPIFKDLYVAAKDIFLRNNDYNYQSLGTELLRNRYADFHTICVTYPKTKFVNLPMDVVYPYLPGADIWAMFFGENDKTTYDTIGIHWYNGSPVAKEYQNNFEKYCSNKSIISRLACSQ